MEVKNPLFKDELSFDGTVAAAATPSPETTTSSPPPYATAVGQGEVKANAEPKLEPLREETAEK